MTRSAGNRTDWQPSRRHGSPAHSQIPRCDRSGYRPGDGDVQDESGKAAPDNEAWVFNPAGEDRFHLDPWLYVGPITGPEGPAGTDGVVGPTGPRGERGEQGVPGLNGAHGGAFAHMVDSPPTNGPAGKIYMVKGDWTMYVTTGK